MKFRFRFLFLYFFFWIAIFFSQKVIFLLYQSNQTSHLDWKLISGIFIYGSRLDLSFAAYLSAIPFLLTALSVIISKKAVWNMINIYTYTTLFIVSFLMIIDLEIFRAWGFRLDSTPLMYLDSPKEMLASAGASPIFLLLMILVVFFLISIISYKYFISHVILQFSEVHFFYAVVLLAFTGILIIPIRGGFQLAPINQSVAYFTTDNFANQAALNMEWNLVHSLTKKTYDRTNPYQFMTDTEAENIVDSLYSQQEAKSVLDINSKKPNVIIIVWESLTAKVVESLGGVKGVTPSLEKLTKEGILFKNIYASGTRSDKGLVAALSGYPAQPTTSIITLPHKSAQLPGLAKDFDSHGYETSFYYGGELEFANIKSYLYNSGFENIVGKDEFPSEDWNSKWGAHDHVVFNRMLKDLDRTKEPFFSVIFTLSSHEPFEVPTKTAIPGDDEESKFLNSHHYTDETVGQFIAEVKNRKWYENTLIVIIADHGHRLPGDADLHDIEKYTIPMLWIGGLIKSSEVITKTCSQTDLAATLLESLHMNHTQYKWSRNIFSNDFKPYAQFAFNNGMGCITENGYTIYDNVGKRIITSTSNSQNIDLQKAKAHLQVSFKDYLNK